MAKSLLSAVVKVSRQIERDAERSRRAKAREHAAAVKEAEKANKQSERKRALAEKGKIADQKRLEREAKAAHVTSMEAEVDVRNAELADIYEDLSSLLAATLDVDDYVDLEKLRRTSESPPFDGGELLTPTPPPKKISILVKPSYLEPPKPKVIFGRKKRFALAVEAAETAHATALNKWEATREASLAQEAKLVEEYEKLERERLESLSQARATFEAEIIEHNASIDSLISNLGYGTTDAIQEYVSIVIANSAYPKYFEVQHQFSFNPDTAELSMKVIVPTPNTFPCVKAYKYKKVSDEIASTKLSQKELKDLYSSAVFQVAIRTFHEVFEADRRGLIATISLEAGTVDTIPATGNKDFIPFVACAAERNAFMEFNLAGITIEETLKHLGAAVSKNPFGLVPAITSGVRKS